MKSFWCILFEILLVIAMLGWGIPFDSFGLNILRPIMVYILCILFHNHQLAKDSNSFSEWFVKTFYIFGI